MGRGRKKANRKFRYLIARMKEVRMRIVLTSHREGLAAQCISGIVANYQDVEKAYHRNTEIITERLGRDLKDDRALTPPPSTPTMGRVQKSGHKKNFHATVQIQNLWHERKTSCTTQQPAGNTVFLAGSVSEALRFVALRFVQLEGCFFLMILFTPLRKAMSQHAAKRESKQADPAEAQGTSVAFGSRKMQSPLLTVMN